MISLRNRIVAFIVLSLLSTFVAGEVLSVNSILSKVVIISIVIYYFALLLSVKVFYVLLALPLYFVSILAIQAFFPILSGPDEKAFFLELNVGSLSLINIVNSYIESEVLFIRSRDTFPAILKLIYPPSRLADESYISVINSIFWVSASYFWSSCVVERFDFLKEKHGKYIFLTMLLAPSSIYWSSVFGKDILAIAFTLLCACFVFKKSYTLFLIFFVLAILIRPYAPIMIAAAIWLLYSNSSVIDRGLKTFSYLYVFISSALLNGYLLLNFFIASLVVLILPSPFSLENWQLTSVTETWIFPSFLLTLESLVLFLLLALLTLEILRNSSFRDRVKLVVGPIFILIFTLVLVGYYIKTQRFEPYALATFGDNLARKKIILWPFISVCIAFFLALNGSNLRSKSRRYSSLR